MNITIFKSTQNSPSWETNIRTTEQEIFLFLRNSKSHYGDRKNQPLYPKVSKMNPIHNFTMFS
jgi:hypothetical protein